MRITKLPLAGPAFVAVVLLAGCGASTPSGSPTPVVSIATTAGAATAAPDTARLDQMLNDLDTQLGAGNKALDDATAAINGGEGEVAP
jgi:hypothetical protein